MIKYAFHFPDGKILYFEIGEGAQSISTAELPSWTRLDFHQCPNCPLRPDQSERCPAAVDVFQITTQFSDVVSYEQVRVKVRKDRRGYEIHCDLQTGLGSLLGLVMAASDCPHLSQLRGLTRLHLPFADLQETLFRSVGLYLLKQYFLAKNGAPPDFTLAGLESLYEDLQIVNTHFKQRIEAASGRDASINAVTWLHSLSTLVSISLEDDLDALEGFLFPDGEVARPPRDPS